MPPETSETPAGLIRSARRPPGWTAPGPAPATPPEAPEIWPRAGEDLCFLSGDWRILQRVDGHRWSLDDLITAWVAADECRGQAPARICDLGCGIGAVLLMMAWRFPTAHLVGVEAQEVSIELARRSVQWNGADWRCEVRHGDLRDPTILPEAHGFDLVTGTPPYLPLGTAHQSQRVQWGPCHFEQRGGVREYIQAAARLLTATGRFVMCAAVRDAQRVAQAADEAALVVTQRLEVIPRDGKAGLFSVYTLRPTSADLSPLIESSLTVRDRHGRRTAAYQAVRGAMGIPP